jgi:hypothetical protein
MKRLIVLAAAAWSLAAPSPAQPATSASDPKAVRVAEQVLDALGGRHRWDDLTGLRWTFGSSVNDTVRSSRRHAWNKHTGEHRVEGRLRTGQAFVFVHTVGDTTHGAAWLDGRALEGDSLHQMIKRADAIWVNDSYWFLMPYKMLDDGVTLKYDGQEQAGDTTFDCVSMSFAGVGLTPGDRYKVFVDHRTHRVERWEYVLQGTTPPPVRWTWEGWEQHDGLWFPTAHRQDATVVFTRDVATSAAFPEGTFRQP